MSGLLFAGAAIVALCTLTTIGSSTIKGGARVIAAVINAYLIVVMIIAGLRL
jgi:hypothetical protein